jgi:hypothetical protein
MESRKMGVQRRVVLCCGSAVKNQVFCARMMNGTPPTRVRFFAVTVGFRERSCPVNRGEGYSG